MKAELKPPAATAVKPAGDATNAASDAAATVAIPVPRKKPKRDPRPGEMFTVADRLVPIPVPSRCSAEPCVGTRPRPVYIPAQE